MKKRILTKSQYQLADLIVKGSLLFCILVFYSCGNSSDSIEDSSTANVKLKMVSASTFVDNASLYAFNTNKQFQYKVLNVERIENNLSTSMAVGNWNLVLLSSDSNIENLITRPSFNGTMSASKMWETPLNSNGEFLTQPPEELRYASFLNTDIFSNTVTYIRNAELNRSVGKIRVILSHSGFGSIPVGQSVTDYVELQDVPTTLSWENKFLPNATTPIVSSKPLRSYLKFDETGKADTVNFIVPAHMGTDGADITTHKVKMKACMMLGGNPFTGKGIITIPYYPEPNHIVEVNLTFRGEPDALLDIKVKVKEWETEIIQDENNWSL